MNRKPIPIDYRSQTLRSRTPTNGIDTIAWGVWWLLVALFAFALITVI